MILCSQIISNSSAAFGTSGVRGLVDDLDDATCFAYTLAFLDYLKTRHRLPPDSVVSIGHDLRPSSPRIARACMAAVQHAGLAVEFSGEIPTPALAFSAASSGQPAIMITGSHIPFDRNGIKFYRADGELMKEDEAPVIESKAEFPATLFEHGWFHPEISGTGASGQLERETQETGEAETDRAELLWRGRYAQAFPQLLSGMRIGQYQHSAAGRDLLADVLTDLGANVVALGRSDEFVPIDTEAVGESDRQQARDWSKKYRLDALVSTDGDGDRPLLADEKGNYFRGDMLGILAAIGLGANAVVTPVSSNSALEKSERFATTRRTKIGSPHVISVMQEQARGPDAIVVGFEPNGGFLSASTIKSPVSGQDMAPLLTRDALLPVLATIALAKQTGLPLSELTGLLPERSTASDRIENIPTDHSRNFIAALKDDLEAAASLTGKGVPPVETDETDGLRMTFPNGDVVHLRPSGNAPELRVYAESDSEQAAEDLLKFAKSEVNSSLARKVQGQA